MILRLRKLGARRSRRGKRPCEREQSSPLLGRKPEHDSALCDPLAVDPLMWPEDEDAIRRHILRHFPYTVFYEIQGTIVTVLAVAHQRRKPGYWRKR